MQKSNKDGNFVYSTNPDFSSEPEESSGETLTPRQQNLRVYPDRKNRNGKTVTVVSGFKGSADDLKELEKKLKSLCGTGGTVKDGDILIQGNFIPKVTQYMEKAGYKFKISGV